MKQRYQKILVGGVFLFFFLVIGYLLYDTLRFSFFFREQQQLFLFDKVYCLKLIFNPGGFAVWFARFIVQFFRVIWCGPIVTGGLLALISFINWRILRRLDNLNWSLPISFIPSLFLSVSLLDSYYYYEGITAYLFFIIGLLLYVKLSDGILKSYFRLLIGLFLTIIVYYVAGAVTILFSVCAFLFDLLAGKKNSLLGLCYLLVAVFLGFLSVRWGIEGLHMYTYTPADYYEITLPMPFVHYVSWWSLPIGMLFIFIVRNYLKNLFSSNLMEIFLIVGILFCYSKIYYSSLDHDLQKFYQNEYLTVEEQWDELLKFSAKNASKSYSDANYMNLALIEKGILTNSLFDYPQHGPLSIAFISNNKVPDIRLAHVLFTMGNMAATQNLAFNACQIPNGYNPTMLKMILQIDLMRGAYPVALKYIELLEKSLFYSKWATEQRKFLFNDELVEQDAFLGMGRRSFPKEEAFVLYNSPMDDLYKILDTNPENTKAMDYALAYLLLAKDINHVRDFVDRYYGTSGLKILPIPVQEALIFYSDYYHTLDEDYALQHGISKEQLVYHLSADLEYCQLHGVTTETIERFVRFKEAYGKFRQNQSTVLAGYEKTFWHYLLFAQI